MLQAPTTANPDQEKSDFEKFLKYFIYRAVQVIVQSRAGCKVSSSSKPFGGSADWFNLAINDIPELFTDTRKHLPSLAPILSDGKAFCLDILLGDSDGELNWSDFITLESWSIRVNTADKNQSVRVCYMVYNRMSTLMKSLLSVTRAVPTQRIASESQSRAGTKIYYKLYLGEPRYALLGERCSIRRIGVVASPFGTVSVSCGYRTVFERVIGPDGRIPAASSSAEKEDAVNTGISSSPNMVEKRHSYPPKRERASTGPASSRRADSAALSDSTRTAFDTLEDDEDGETEDRDRDIPFHALLTKARAPLRSANVNIINNTNASDRQRVGSVQSDRDRSASESSNSSKAPSSATRQDEAIVTSLSQTITPDDYVVVNYKAPLSLAEASGGERQPADVAWLYSEFKGLQLGSPPLSFAEARGAPTVSSLLDAFIRTDLPHYTQLGTEFDAFVTQEFAEQFAAFQKANELDDAE